MSIHWADQLADKTVDKFPDQDTYVVSSGISPSGTVHVGNFREIITTHLVAESLRRKGADVRFIYSWDDYDRFRKVPDNVPDSHEQYIGLPLRDVPDPEGCHESYAEHFEQKLESDIEGLGIKPEFIRQGKMFRNCEYSGLIEQIMADSDEIRSVLNEYRTEDLDPEWLPINVYCKQCGKDFVKDVDYLGGSEVSYYCNVCEESKIVDFAEEDSVKPPWRVDWPMRWKYESVNFEPAGKEHSADTGSRDTANALSSKIFDIQYPVHQMYEFVTKDGSKISASEGENTFSIGDLKEIYTPRLVRYLFAGARPSAAFEIPFESEDIFQRYNKFDEIERAYFSDSDQDTGESEHLSRVYELSCISVPDQQPHRVDFKHASIVAQAVPRSEWGSTGINKLVESGHLPENPSEYEVESALQRLERGFSWARDYGPDKYRFVMESDYVFSDSERLAAEDLVSRLEASDNLSPDAVDEIVFDVKDDSSLDTGEFFSAMYKKLLGKDHGPRLSTLISAMDAENLKQNLLG